MVFFSTQNTYYAQIVMSGQNRAGSHLRQWLAPACNSQKGKQIALWSLSVHVASLFHAALVLPFFHLRVSSFQLFQTLLRAITTGLSGRVKGGASMLLGLLVGRSHVPQNIHTTPSAHNTVGNSVIFCLLVAVLVKKFVLNSLVFITFTLTLLITSHTFPSTYPIQGCIWLEIIPAVRVRVAGDQPRLYCRANRETNICTITFLILILPLLIIQFIYISPSKTSVPKYFPDTRNKTPN